MFYAIRKFIYYQYFNIFLHTKLPFKSYILYYIIIYYIILCYIILYYIILYYIILYYIILYYIILYCIILYYIILYFIILQQIRLYQIILYQIILDYIRLNQIKLYQIRLYQTILDYIILHQTYYIILDQIILDQIILDQSNSQATAGWKWPSNYFHPVSWPVNKTHPPLQWLRKPVFATALCCWVDGTQVSAVSKLFAAFGGKILNFSDLLAVWQSIGSVGKCGVKVLLGVEC